MGSDVNVAMAYLILTGCGVFVYTLSAFSGSEPRARCACCMRTIYGKGSFVRKNYLARNVRDFIIIKYLC